MNRDDQISMTAGAGPYPPARGIGFAEAVRRGYRGAFDLSGRATRAEFWWWVLFVLLAGVVMRVMDLTFGLAPLPTGQGPLQTAFFALHLIPGTAVAVRRLHDIGRSGWWLAAPGLCGAVAIGSLVLAPILGDRIIGLSHDATMITANPDIAAIGALLLLILSVLAPLSGANRFGPIPSEVAR